MFPAIRERTLRPYSLLSEAIFFRFSLNQPQSFLKTLNFHPFVAISLILQYFINMHRQKNLLQIADQCLGTLLLAWFILQATEFQKVFLRRLLSF
ncbi:hypothetical protein FGO68_gene13806 [Halteria grandinella]|uniref:Uncharacterized protein n=1 Tax=Halteria grandinella TaxID=5974 RepID=A0A8J8NXJ9_HALGN|nr:hypothetical protein FGO68_gene13806 [Halteria grandinella]